MKNTQKVLIISHNPISVDSNMGLTLSAYFEEWEKESIAQLYFRPEFPSGNVCNNYYQFTDLMAIKSFINWGLHGNIITNLDEETLKYREDTKVAYELGLKKKPHITFLRNLIWKFSNWNNKHFKKWIESFKPDIIFYAAGDYSFSYKIAYKIAKKYNIPLMVCFFDDFLLFNMNNKGLIGKINYSNLKKWAKKTISLSKSYFVTNELMSEDYNLLFNVKPRILYTAGIESFYKKNDKKVKVSYIGNLGLGRAVQILNIGRVLKNMCDPRLPQHIDVYSKVSDLSTIKDFTEDNGIKFHGAIPYDKVDDIIRESMAVLHVESFDEIYRKRVHYSLSTKIADSLGSGTLLVAYGPHEVASIRYLKDNQCAVVATEDDNLEEVLRKILDTDYVDQILKNAQEVFLKNHTKERNNRVLIDEINRLL